MISSAKLKNMYILTTVLYCVCVGRAAAKTTLNPRALSASAGNRCLNNNNKSPAVFAGLKNVSVAIEKRTRYMTFVAANWQLPQAACWMQFSQT